MWRSSTASRSASKPTTVEKPRASFQTASQRLARATASRSIAFAVSYGGSTPIRQAPGVFPLCVRAASSASSMLCRAISSCAFALSASASSGNPVASALARRARIRLSMRDSGWGEFFSPLVVRGRSRGSRVGRRRRRRYSSRAAVACEKRSVRVGCAASSLTSSSWAVQRGLGDCRFPAVCPCSFPYSSSYSSMMSRARSRTCSSSSSRRTNRTTSAGCQPRRQAPATNSRPRRASSSSAVGSAASREAPVSRAASVSA